jgi:hypothetical protein
METKRSERVTLTVAAVLGVCLLSAWGYPQRDRFLAGHNDFLQLYTGASLVGAPGLYSPQANREFHLEAAGVSLESVYYSRPPFYAFLLRPLALMPYRAAYAVFQALNFVAIALFLWHFARPSPEVAIFASLFLPLLCNLLNGQDVGLALAAAGLAVISLRRGKPFSAGLWFSLCAIKFHLFALIPLVLILRKQWRVLAGGATGGAAFTALSFLAAGWDWPARYLELLRNPVLHPSPERSANIRGLVWPLAGESLWLQAILSLAAVALVVWAVRKAPDLESALAYGITGGILVSYHCYLQDTLLLLLVFAIVVRASTDAPLRAAAALMVAPPLAICLLMGPPYSAALPAAGIVFLALACRPAALKLPAMQPASA